MGKAINILPTYIPRYECMPTSTVVRTIRDQSCLAQGLYHSTSTVAIDFESGVGEWGPDSDQPKPVSWTKLIPEWPRQ